MSEQPRTAAELAAVRPDKGRSVMKRDGSMVVIREVAPDQPLEEFHLPAWVREAVYRHYEWDVRNGFLAALDTDRCDRAMALALRQHDAQWKGALHKCRHQFHMATLFRKAYEHLATLPQSDSPGEDAGVLDVVGDA